MFTEIYKLLKSQDWYNISAEIEILKGKYEKISNLKELVEKGKRKGKYKYYS